MHLSAATRRACAFDVNAPQTLLTITQHALTGGLVWMRDGLLLIRAVWTGKHDALRDLFPYLRGFTRFPEPLQQPAAGTKAGRRQT